MENIVFWQRELPSANVILVRGDQNVLIDSGFGADAEELLDWLPAHGVEPQSLALVANTHFHSDHVGGNHTLQSQYGVRIGAHAWEASLVNRRAPEACSAEWLDQPVEPYRVDDQLADGDDLHLGGVTLRVVHTPGHTLGHLSFYVPEERVLIVGDTVHQRDVAWLNPFLEGVGAIDRLIGSLEALAAFPARLALTGHGPPLTDPQGELRAGIQRLLKWQREPERMWWHGVKRTFAYALMLRGGLSEEDVEPYILRQAWAQDYARRAFDVPLEEFPRLVVTEMLRSGAAHFLDGRLVAALPHRVPSREWLAATPAPQRWPL